VSLSIPDGLLESLEGSVGFHKEAFIEAHENQGPNTSIRYNPLKMGAYKGPLPIAAQRIPWNPYGYYLDKRPSFTHDPLFHGGLYYVQEPGSQFLWETLSQTVDAGQSVRVLDLCAAPGGKSTLLASYFKNGLIVSNEVMKNRAVVLTENATKWGTGNIVVSCNDPRHFQRLKGYFDVIVVDAPCSGSGLLRKDPVAIEQWTEELVQRCSLRQQQILSDVLPALKQDGILIYSTCSYSVKEDEDIMDFLSIQLQLENIALKDIPRGITAVSGKIKGAQGQLPIGYKFFPDQVKSEGFFISVFKKKVGELPSYGSGEQVPGIAAKDQAMLKCWVKPELDLYYFKQGADILAIENKWVADLGVLQKNLFLKKAGVAIGEIKGKGLVPAHDLAVSLWVNPAVSSFEMDRAQSLQYLKSQAPEIDLEKAVNGWNIAVFEGVGLGWMKILPGRINNYYPKNWRILKE